MSIYTNYIDSSSIEGLYSSSAENSPIKSGKRSNSSFSAENSPFKPGKGSNDSFSWDYDSCSLDSPVKKMKFIDSDSSHDSPIKKQHQPNPTSYVSRKLLLAEDVDAFEFAMDEENNAYAFMNQLQKTKLRGKEILDVKYSQHSISSKTTDEKPLYEIVESMHTNGWNLALSKGIQCVEMPGKQLVSLDNRRLYCAKQVQSSTFTMPIVMCHTQNDCVAVVRTLFSQMESNKKQFISKMLPKYMLIKELLSQQSPYEGKVTFASLPKIIDLSVGINNRILCAEQIDTKLEKTGVLVLPDSPQWCVYARMRMFNANIDDRRYGYEETNVAPEKS